MKRISVTVSDETHRYLTGLAHERTVSESKRVSVNAVASGIIDISIGEMKKVEATIADLADRGRRTNGGDRD